MSLLTPGENPAIDAETRVPILIGTAIAITVASTLVVMLRLYTRHVIVHAPGIDDYTMVIATVCFFLSSAALEKRMCPLTPTRSYPSLSQG